MKTSKVEVVAVAILVVVAIARTSTAADFKPSDFKGTYVSGLPGDAAGTGTFHGIMYLVADDEGGVSGSWVIVDADTHTSFSIPLNTSYTVSPEGRVLVTSTGADGVFDTQVAVFLANNKEILGYFFLFDPIFGMATVHGVQQRIRLNIDIPHVG